MVRNTTFSISRSEMAERETFLVAIEIDEIGDYFEGKRQADARELELHALFFLLSLHHFDTPPTISQKNVVDIGCKLACEFFTGGWWKNHKRDVAHMSRKKDNEDLAWLGALRLACLFAALNSDARLLKRLGDWPSSWMRAEWQADPFPEGIEQLYFSVLTASGFGEIDSDRGRISDARIKLLFDAVSEPDNGSLATALNDSLVLFNKSLKGKKVLPYEAIAIEESVIVLLWKLSRNTNLFDSIDSDLQPHILRLVE